MTSEKKTKAAVTSQISHIRERVGTTTQFISRIPTTLREAVHVHGTKEDNSVDAIAEVGVESLVIRSRKRLFVFVTRA